MTTQAEGTQPDLTVVAHGIEVVHSGTTEQQGSPSGPVPGPPSGPTSRRPSFTVTEAATACSVSRKTITRKLAELALHGAAKDDDGVWRIPVEALLAAGLHPGRSLPASAVGGATPLRATETASPGSSGATPVAQRPQYPPAVMDDSVTVPRQRWDDIRIRLARAEAEAAERALALADARLALRALTAAPAQPVPAPVPAPAPTQPAIPLAGPAAPVRKKRWWHSS